MAYDWRAAVAQAAAVAEPIQRELMQELVPGRVCHIDGDYLAYFAAGNNDLPVGTARHIAKERIEAFRDMSGSTKAHVHLTAKGSTKGERFLIATVKKYQGQRAGHHPKNWAALREYLEHAEYVPFTRKIWHDREADDGMAYASAVPVDPVSSVVVATRDKDMRMFPGCHIDWLDYTLTEVPKGAYEVIGKSGLVFGHKWFWLQMLQGDTADNIPGLESYEGKTIGETRAAEHLAGTTCNEEAFEVVSRMYESTYGWEAGYDRLVEQAALLWMRPSSHAPIHDLLYVVPSSPDIRAALGRLINRVKEQRAQIDEYNHRAVQAADDEGTGE